MFLNGAAVAFEKLSGVLIKSVFQAAAGAPYSEGFPSRVEDQE